MAISITHPHFSMCLGVGACRYLLLLHFLLFSSLRLASGSPILGFCYYNVYNDSYSEDRYKTDFFRAQNLPGTSGWNTAELYTPLGPNNTGISPAITAAVATKTKLLIAICALPVNGSCSPSDELDAIRAAIAQYGSDFTDLVVGIQMTDYAISIYNQDPSAVAASISLVRTSLGGTALEGVPVGTREYPGAWQYSSMEQIIDVCDFLFVRIYPMTVNLTTDLSTGIALAKKDLADVQNVARGKPVWVSTGWPNTGVGTTIQFAMTPSVSDAKAYWDDFGCGTLFDSINTFWGTVEPTGFGDDMLDSDGNPVHNLTCPNASASDNSSATSNQPMSSTLTTGTTTSTVSAPNLTTTSTDSGASEDGSGDSWKIALGVGLGIGMPVAAALSWLAFLFWREHFQDRNNQPSLYRPPSPESRPYIFNQIQLVTMNGNEHAQPVPGDDSWRSVSTRDQDFTRRVSIQGPERFDVMSNDSRDNAGPHTRD